MQLHQKVYNLALHNLRYYFEQGRQQLGNRLGKPSRNKIIILGNQKSGTTAIAALLAKATQLDAALDLPPTWEPALGKMYLGSLKLKDIIDSEKYLFSRQIIKEPNLTFFYNQVKEAYPNSRYIFIVRNPLQNIRSLLNRMKLPGDAVFEGDLVNKLDIHSQSLFNKSYHPYYSSHYIEMLALRWKFCANLYLQNRHNLRLVKYEDFTNNKQAYIEQLVQELKLEVRADISPWLNHRFQPKGNANVNLKEFYGGANYQNILNICVNEMKALGYK